MAHETGTRTSAEIEREVEQQRARVEDTIDQITQKLSPGQLIDELLAYSKGGGGAFVGNLQRTVVANPVPAALLGVSLAWLMAKPAPSDKHAADRAWDESINRNRGYGSGGADVDYPVATISTAGLQRVRHVPDETGQHYSEFVDDSGMTYRARSETSGRRSGHFVDSAGNRFRGFVDASGNQIRHFRDEAGNLLDDVLGWSSHALEKAHLGDSASAMRSQIGSLNDSIIHQLRDQPLVGGALAFALGAALGTALPHTDQEDAVMGEAADALKQKAGEEAEHVYQEGRERVSEIYEGVAGTSDAVPKGVA
jgi:hypothetical protein